MAREKIVIRALNARDYAAAIRRIRAKRLRLNRAAAEICRRCAEMGMDVANVAFAGAEYDGVNDAEVTAEKRGENRYAVVANGEAVLFIEFGSGVTKGYGHPEAEKHGMGPGTWSEGPKGKGHWDDPGGWYYAHGKHSYGNPPARAMYEARKEMEQRLAEIAREVLGQ